MVAGGFLVALIAYLALSSLWSKSVSTTAKLRTQQPVQTPAKRPAQPAKRIVPAKSIEGEERILPNDIVALNRRLIEILKSNRRDPRFFNKSLPIEKALEESTGAEPVTNSPIKLAKQMQENIRMGFPFLVIPAYGNNYGKQREILEKCITTGACSETGEGKDVRSFGFERWSTDANQFANDAFLGTIIENLEALYGYPSKGKKSRNMVLAGVIKAQPRSKLASGGGWHVDDSHCLGQNRDECTVRPNSIKMMLLLNDVPTDNGTSETIPIEQVAYDPGLYHAGPFCMLIKRGHYNEVRHNKDARKSRIDDEELTRYLQENEDAFVLEFVAPEGTVILFETQHVHRGKVIERGVRSTLTVYVNKVFPQKYDATKACKAELR